MKYFSQSAAETIGEFIANMAASPFTNQNQYWKEERVIPKITLAPVPPRDPRNYVSEGVMH